LNKAVEEKTEEQQDNNSGEKNQECLSLSAQAYKLFSDRKTPLEVAIVLNLREPEATEFYKEYWKLKQLYNLNIVYEELRGDIEPFLKLHKLSDANDMGVKQIVNLLQIANNDLPAIEERVKRLRNDTNMMQFRKQTLERNLYQLNNQIASTTKLLNSLRVSCGRERREIGNLQNEKARLNALITGFKNSSEEYNKIKQAADENVKSVLTNGKFLLKLATLSVIESLRSNTELYNFVLYNILNSNAACYGSNYPSLVLKQRQQHIKTYENLLYITMDISLKNNIIILINTHI
jgi:hypothetical protein